MTTYLVLTAIGEDKPGLVESLARIISDNSGNWLESSMSQLAGKFAGILRVSVNDNNADKLIHALENITDQLKLVIERADADGDIEFQQAVKSTLSEFLLDRESETSIMVQMPTGSGKTRVAMEAIYDFLRIKTNKQEDISIIWLAHTDELCEQAVESFEMGWKNIGSFEVNVLRLWAGNAAKIEAIPAGINFAVCSMQSAYSMLKTQNQKIENLFTSLRSKTKILILKER